MMFERIRIFACLIALVAAPSLAGARDRPYLPPEVQQVMAKLHIPGTSLSVIVREIGRDEPLISYNSAVPRNPASTMKVLTTYAALELLGPAYTWRTRAYATGPVRDQVLDGNLVLVGGGDPFLTAERWWGFVSGLRQEGIERVTGDVIIDNSLFASQGEDRGAFDNRPFRTYNVLPDALLVNFQTVTFSLFPDLGSGSLRASVNPWPANLAIDNTARLDRSACRRGSGGIAVTMPDGPSGHRIAVSGHYASGCGPMTLTRPIMRAPDFAYGTFKTFWQQSGGKLEGGWRVGVVPPDAKLLYSDDSLSLAEIIRLVNKFSSNTMARQLLLTLAVEKAGRPGTTAGGSRVITDFLASRGISIPDLVLENGSGLSREERISAQGLADILLDAWHSQYFPEFAASLPLSATDGTLRRRFRSPEMQGRLRMKTGTLEGVSALAGYVNAASGRTFVAVIILNHPSADNGAGTAVQTALVQWVFGQ
jgi:D-alanyl-D-alanine carboxypeptidase/D-alanyl-D-alanine-endopeptidase (penicillin-binding protein 4)